MFIKHASNPAAVTEGLSRTLMCEFSKDVSKSSHRPILVMLDGIKAGTTNAQSSGGARREMAAPAPSSAGAFWSYKAANVW